MAPKAQIASASTSVDDQPNPVSKDMADSGISHNKSTSHNTTPATVQSAKATDVHDTPDNAADSQPMTKSTSSGSNPPSKDNMSGPSPYGTRSRNRGQARPNYAEDKDIDMYDAYPEKKEDEPKKSTSRQNGSADASRGSSRKSAVNDESKTSNSHTGTAASSNTAASSLASTSQSNKKRKAPAQCATNGTSTSTQGLSTIATTRRSAASTSAAGAGHVQGHHGHGQAGYKESNMLSFETSGAKPKNGKMVADDGTELQLNDHVYLVCEPPGEPYYLGRIMEFLHVQNDNTKAVDALRINWYYRPKDIGKKVNDTRLVFATMHSDISPLTALRGKCMIRHKTEIENMDAYRKKPDCFWFEKLYDRYIQKNYEVIPCSQIVNVPENVKKVLDERWKYILVEQGRSKEFTSAVKLCKRCTGYCANNDSVDCAVCQQTYHMNCVKPPLLKKPSRGFAWACAACSRAQERKLEARNTPSLLDPHPDLEEEEWWDEEEEDHGPDTNRTSPTDGIDDSHQPATAEQMYHASLWPYRYLGIHCKPEDALDYDDRIYPRAGSRLGPKHQATVLPWPGRPVKLVKPLEIKKSGRKDSKLSKETLAAIEADKIAREKRPKYIQDEPPGYVARGEDDGSTITVLWKPPATVGATIKDEEIDEYMSKAQALAPSLGLPERSTNLADIARNTLFRNNFDTTKALKVLPKTPIEDFKEPVLNATELKKFEEGVTRFGSELYHVTRHVKTVEHKNIVRFYYTWKKTDRGKQIWGNFNGRKGKKEAKKAEATANKLQDDVADDHDDSAFDTDKAVQRKRQFMCKFCSTKTSRQWRRAPNVSTALITEGSGKNKDKGAQYIVALCRRCAELWRRYAIQWEDVEELAKKVAAAGGRAWKRRVDEELLKELKAANDMMNMTVYNAPVPAPVEAGVSATASHASSVDPPRKKLKTIADKDAEPSASDSGSVSGVPVPKKKEKEKAVEKLENPPPPPVPEIPKPRVLPCAICRQMNPTGDQLLSCKECRLSVHRKCYGVMDSRQPGKWTCDMCLNDKNPHVSLEYKCVLCPVEHTEHDFVDPPKNTHKKKTDKEKEKERLEREAQQKAADYYRKKQEEMNRPVNPREPLKRTADNNWAHITCTVWTPEVKFGNARALSPSEGIPSIPRARYDEVCKACKQKGGACVACHQCRAPVHVECAHKCGYLLGFEVTPVKGSRRDQHNIVTINGETGAMSAAIWCKEHIPTRTLVHRMYDSVNQADHHGKDALALNALQLYVQNFKQADLALTGTVRKANLIAMATKQPAPTPTTNANRRASTTTMTANGSAQRADEELSSTILQSGDKICITCGIDVSPKWHRVEKSEENALINGHSGSLGSEAQKFVEQRNFQCHKCKKWDRKPTPHTVPPPPPPPPRADSLPQVEADRAPHAPAIAAALTSPPPVLAESRSALAHMASPWPHAVQPGPTGPPPPLVPLPVAAPVAAPPMQAPSAGPAAPLPLNSPYPGPSPMAAPVAQPVAPHHYAPTQPNGPLNDWHRSTTQQQPPPVHQVNGSSVGSNPLHNHLRDLRPPPIAPVSHHQPSPLQTMVNGIPPSSPRRASATVQNGTTPYLTSYHHQTHHSLHNLTNGGPPPRAGEHSFSTGLLPSRSPFSPPHAHGSPPLPRDGLPRDGLSMSREPNLANNLPPRSADGRSASGASASPSLRNLLS